MSENSSHDLYFLRLIQDALDAEDSRTALLEAIERVRHIGLAPEYREGYANFLLFVQTVEEALAEDGGAAATVQYLKALRDETAQFHGTSPLEVEILKDGKPLGNLVCSDQSGQLSLRQITPGLYEVSLSNGRLLWSRELADKDLRWSIAYPQTEYPAAAMTGPAQAKPTISESLLDGSLLLEVLPGIESGTLRIDYHIPNHGRNLT